MCLLRAWNAVGNHSRRSDVTNIPGLACELHVSHLKLTKESLTWPSWKSLSTADTVAGNPPSKHGKLPLSHISSVPKVHYVLIINITSVLSLLKLPRAQSSLVLSVCVVGAAMEVDDSEVTSS